MGLVLFLCVGLVLFVGLGFCFIVLLSFVVCLFFLQKICLSYATICSSRTLLCFSVLIAQKLSGYYDFT